MPSEFQSASQTDRKRYPDIVAEHGEDPARFLDCELVERGPEGTDRSRKRLAIARIRGIDSLALLQQWIRVENDLGRGPDGTARNAVIEHLIARKQTLETEGERADRCDFDAVPDPTDRVDRRTAADYAAMREALPTGSRSDALDRLEALARERERECDREADDHAGLTDALDDLENDLDPIPQ